MLGAAYLILTTYQSPPGQCWVLLRFLLPMTNRLTRYNIASRRCVTHHGELLPLGRLRDGVLTAGFAGGAMGTTGGACAACLAVISAAKQHQAHR